MSGLLPGWPGVLAGMLGTLGMLTLLGWKLAGRLAPAGMARAALAPSLGLCLHLPFAALLLPWLGVSRASILALLLLGCGLPLVLRRNFPDISVSRWALPVAIAGGAAAAAAIMPHLFAGGLRLGLPIFDHVKIALVDAIARQGLPAVDPFIGGTPHPLAYYFWWHLGAAELARVAGTSGWAADAALTGATGAASLLLASGIGQMIAGRTGGVLTPLLMLPGSLRWLLRPAEDSGWVAEGTGLEGWLNQASWAPQHVAAASCLLVAVLLIVRLRERTDAVNCAVLGLAVAAGFGCSAWVGGIATAAALPMVCLVLLPGKAPRGAYVAGLLLAGSMALLLVLPLALAEWRGTLGRGSDAPLAFGFYPAFGPRAPHWLTPLGFPVLWCIEFPALLVAGCGVALTARKLSPAAAALLAAAGSCLGISWLVRSTIDNNDLGWRAMLPVLLVAAAFAARGWLAGGAPVRSLGMLGLLGLPGAALLLQANVAPPASAAGPALAASLPAWRALRAATPATDEVLTDPAFAADATRWPADIGWALLSNRRACYGGWAAAHAFAPMPAAALYRIDRLVARVYAGVPNPGDLPYLAGLGCARALLMRGDPAFAHDPFAAGGWMLVAASPDWRIYSPPARSSAPPP